MQLAVRAPAVGASRLPAGLQRLRWGGKRGASSCVTQLGCVHNSRTQGTTSQRRIVGPDCHASIHSPRAPANAAPRAPAAAAASMACVAPSSAGQGRGIPHVPSLLFDLEAEESSTVTASPVAPLDAGTQAALQQLHALLQQQDQVIEPTEDGKPFDASDAQLSLDKGTPRFYIMRLPRRGLSFSRITFHADVTQCLGGLSPPQPWYIVVAAPTGSVQAFPQQQQLQAFKVPPGVAVKFKAGTWHAGPLFDGADAFDFFNLELSDTNVVDHNTHDYAAAEGGGVTYTVLEC